MIIYAAKTPIAHAPQNIAKRCLFLMIATSEPMSEPSMIAFSPFDPHFKYAHVPFCACSVVPVFVQILYASNAFQKPSLYEKKDVKKSAQRYQKKTNAAPTNRAVCVESPRPSRKFFQLNSLT